MALLLVNCGSSSLKFELRDEGGPPLARGQVSGIGARSEERPAADHAQAVAVMVDALREQGLAEQVSAVSHRIVHGGSRFSAPLLIDGDALEGLRRLAELAPLHKGR